MDKRLMLAIGLSLLILITWSAIIPKSAQPTKAAEQNVSSSQPVLPKTTTLEPAIDLAPPTLLSYQSNASEMSFIEPSAAIKEIVFKDYKSHKLQLEQGFAFLDNTLKFQKIKGSSQEAVFRYRDDNKEFIKRFIFSKSKYTMDLEIAIRNLSLARLDINYPLILGVINFKANPTQMRYQEFVVGLAEKTLHLNGQKEAVWGNAKFIALRDRYFCAILEPLSEECTVKILKLNAAESAMVLAPKDTMLEPGAVIKETFRIYLGPQDLRTIQDINTNWGGVVNYGTFDFIAHLLLQLLAFFYSIVHNWGWAIIFLSVAIYLILFPLTLKQMRSMKEMQALQPRIEELKKLHKDNPQKLHKETLALYKQHKVNPLGGCLPLLLQMPIFFALYQALARSVVLKGSAFLWIKDLSEPDHLFTLPMSIPVLGNQLNILPILMMVVMFFQQRASMANTSSEHAEQQKMMLIVFPLMFGFIFYNMPAGLVLYWFINSLLTVIFQFRVNRAK